MALTRFQRAVSRLLAEQRLRSGESYVAGGGALNELIHAGRLSRDLDLFHDTAEALQASWDSDRELLLRSGYTVKVLRERPAFVEALVAAAGDQVLIRWTCDSAFRFFELLEHQDLGLTLHPFDLATNKVLALVGRLEARDWVDVIHACDAVQPLGLLAWSASGKDPGLSPAMILAEARRSGRYTELELQELAFEGPPPAAGELARRWSALLVEAETVIDILPLEKLGACVLERTGRLFRGDAASLEKAILEDLLLYHEGSIRAAFPSLRSG
jgi:hypothetical protein